MQRPTSVTVFGICGVLASVVLFLPQSANSNNPVIQIIHDNPAYAAWVKVSIVLGLGVSMAMLAAGIGLLKLKPWARIFSIAYGIYAIVMIFVGMVVNYFFLFQPMMEQAHQKQGPEAAMAIGAAVGGTFSGCFGIIYPILLLIFMMRPKAVAAFRPSIPADGQI